MDEEELANLSDKIDELAFWMKFSVWTTFVNIAKATLKDDMDKLVYALSDGNKSTREIAELVSIGDRRITDVTVANMWQRWAAVPLVIPARKVGRFRKVVPLKSIGIAVPKFKGLIEEKGEDIEESENLEDSKLILTEILNMDEIRSNGKTTKSY